MPETEATGAGSGSPPALPPPREILEIELADGTRVAVRRHGNPAGPAVLVSHGNGLAADAYYPFWKELESDFELFVYDFRSHGWNGVGDLRRHHFPGFVWDNERIVAGVASRLGGRPLVGAYHSMSAIVALLQVLRAGPRFDALMLFEPPLMPPPGHPLEELALEGQAAFGARTRARRSVFPSPESYARVLAGAPQFSRLVPGAVELIAATTLRERPDGRWELRCPTEYEARIYEGNLDSTMAMRMGAFPVPVHFLYGDPHHPDARVPSLACHALAAEWDLPGSFVPGTGHFLQLEAPGECARRLRGFLAEIGIL